MCGASEQHGQSVCVRLHNPNTTHTPFAYTLSPPLEVVGGLRPIHGRAGPGVARVLVGQVELAGVALLCIVRVVSRGMLDVWWWCGGSTSNSLIETPRITAGRRQCGCTRASTHLQCLIEVEAPDEAALLLLGQRHLEQPLLSVEPVGSLLNMWSFERERV